MNEKQHAERFKHLEGKQIKSVRFMTTLEASVMHWDKRPLIIEFTDGSFIMPMADDEGNDGGAMAYQHNKQEATIYTL